MILGVAAALTVLLVLAGFVQLLYQESMRLRARDVPALEYFKEELEQRIGLKPEEGLLAFSLLKHSLLVALGFTVAGRIAGAGAFSWRFAAEALGLGLLLMFAGAYLGPHLLYRATGARWLAPLAAPLRLVGRLAKPFIATVSIVGKLASIGEENGGEEENASTAEEDLEALIEAGADEGLIEEEDRELIHSVVALGDKTVRQVMTPRPSIVAIPEDATVEEARAVALEHPYSRFPVYRGSIDNITGFIHVRDILQLDYEQRNKRQVKEFAHPPKFVPETKPIVDLLREMQKEKLHLAIVVDEYGDVAGLVTMEDVVEEVFGEIRDEYDSGSEIIQESDGVYLVSGNVDVDALEDLVLFQPKETPESTTVGGLVCEWLGRVPEPGEAVERDGIRLEVTAADDRHVKQVRVSRAAPVKH